MGGWAQERLWVLREGGEVEWSVGREAKCRSPGILDPTAGHGGPVWPICDPVSGMTDFGFHAAGPTGLTLVSLVVRPAVAGAWLAVPGCSLLANMPRLLPAGAHEEPQREKA